MAGGGTLFGQVLYLRNQSGAIVFILVLVVFTLFEGLLHIIEVECAKIGFKGLIKKLYREFMIMGFISFAILLATEAYANPEGEWFDSFNFAHIVLLFIGITFLVQSGTLALLINSRNRTLLAHDNSSSESLIIQYIQLHKQGGLMRWLFEHGPVTVPVPELREKIEYKIIQEFFIRNYNLPVEFRFANYMCTVLKHYVISLVEVRPISWVILASFVAVNYARIALIDPVYETPVCRRYPNKNLHRSGFEEDARRTLTGLMDVNIGTIGTALYHYVAAGDSTSSSSYQDGSFGDASNYYTGEFDYGSGNAAYGIDADPVPFAGGGGTGDDHGDDDEDYGEHVCTEYMLRYVFVCSMLLVLYLLGVLLASEIYMQRLIDKVLDQEETIEWLEEEEDRELLRQAAAKAPATDDGYSLQPVESCDEDAKTGGAEDDEAGGAGRTELTAAALAQASAAATAATAAAAAATATSDAVAACASTTTLPPEDHQHQHHQHHHRHHQHPSPPHGGRRVPRRLTQNARMGSLYGVEGELGSGPASTAAFGMIGPAAARRLSVYQRIGSLQGTDFAPFQPAQPAQQGLGHHPVRGRAASLDDGPGEFTGRGVLPVVQPEDIFAAAAKAALAEGPRRGRTHSSSCDAAGTAGSAVGDVETGAHGGGGVADHPRTRVRRRTTTARLRSMSLRSDNGGDHVAVAADPALVSPGSRRRMTAHRLNSLRSQGSGSAGDDHAEAIATSGTRASRSAHMRAGSSFRIARCNSFQSGDDDEGFNAADSDEDGDGADEAPYLWGCFSNRRFLYLGCLERIMNEEFNFHANEARKMSVVAERENDRDVGNRGRSSTLSRRGPDGEREGEEAAGEGERPASKLRRRFSSGQAQEMNTIAEAEDDDDGMMLPASGTGTGTGTDSGTDLLLPPESKEDEELYRVPSTGSTRSPRGPHIGGRTRSYTQMSGSELRHASQFGSGDSGLLRRTASGHFSPVAGGGGGTVQHQDMCSNFRMMKELREEMLISTGQAHHHHNSHGAGEAGSGGGENGSESTERQLRPRKSLFGSLSFFFHTETADPDADPVPEHTGSSAASVAEMRHTGDGRPYQNLGDRKGRGSKGSDLAIDFQSIHSKSISRMDSDLESQYSTYRPQGNKAARTYSLHYITSPPHSSNNNNHGGGGVEGGQRNGIRGRGNSMAEDMQLGKEAAALAVEAAEADAALSPRERWTASLASTGRYLWSGLKYLSLRAAGVLLGHHLGLAEEDISPDDDVAVMQRDFSTIFLFNNAEVYYHMVELALLIQCVYLALWATNFVLVAKESYYPVLWNIALVVPLPINFLILKQIIFTSAMLKSIVTLDKYVADKICEEAVDVQNVTQRVRKVVRHALRAMDVPKEQWFIFTKEQFGIFIPPGDRGLNLRNMKLFLHSMQIFLTDKSVQRIFGVLDFDRSGKVTWEDIFPVVFPDLQRKQLQVQRGRQNSSRGKPRRQSTIGTIGTGGDDGESGSSTRKGKGKRRESVLEARSSLVLQARIDSTSTAASSLLPLDDGTPDQSKHRKRRGIGRTSQGDALVKDWRKAGGHDENGNYGGDGDGDRGHAVSFVPHFAGAASGVAADITQETVRSQSQPQEGGYNRDNGNPRARKVSFMMGDESATAAPAAAGEWLVPPRS